jgi:hypothetical protein
MDALQAEVAAVDTYATNQSRHGMELLGAVNINDLKTELANGTIDMLLAYTWDMLYTNPLETPVFTADVEYALSTALSTGNLKKLMVW